MTPLATQQAKLNRLICAIFAIVGAVGCVNAFRVPVNPTTISKRSSIPIIEYKRCERMHRKSQSTSFSVLLSSPNNDENKDDEDSTVDIGNSLEILALSVAIFFVATVAFVGGDKLFATASPASSGSPRVIIDADAVLREDFERSSTAVLF